MDCILVSADIVRGIIKSRCGMLVDTIMLEDNVVKLFGTETGFIADVCITTESTQYMGLETRIEVPVIC